MKKSFTIWLDRETLSLLRAEAEYEGVSPEKLVEKIIRDYLDQRDSGPDAPA